MSEPGRHTTDTVDQRDVVRATFVPNGKEYHYYLPGAEMGDIITGPGATGPATVVGFSARNYKGPLKRATFFAKPYAQAAARKRIYQKAVATMNAPTETAVETAERQLKAARKAEKLARKAAKLHAAAHAERARQRKAAFAALEAIAVHGTDDAAVNAALAILDRA